MSDKSLLPLDSWTSKRLDEVVEITSSKRIFAEEYLTSGIPFYRGKEIIEKYNGNPVSTDLYISEDKFDEIKRKFGAPVNGELLLTSVGTLGIPYIVKEGEKFYFKDGNLTWFRNFNGIDNHFLYYWIISDLGKEQLANNTIGSTQQALTIAGLKSALILLPSLDEQRSISAVLSTLDDKIELLREENKTLEATAQAIFKEWFVNFNFPGSTRKMIDSEFGEVPEGWRVGKMEEVVSIRGGTTPSTQNRNYWDGDIYWTSPKDLSNSKGIFLLNTEKKITEEGIKQISSGLLPIKTLLLSSRAPIGYLAITNISVAINQGYIAFLPDQYFSTYFMYLWLKLNMQTVIGSANGSTFMEISKSSFRNIECIIPEESVLRKFDTTTESIFNKILSNVLQIETLANLRDSLLPRLMKGEVRVKGFNN